MGFRSTAKNKSYRDYHLRTFISGGGGGSGFDGGVPDNGTPTPQLIELEYLIIAGGGGTSCDGSGGGGGGGYLEGTYTITTGVDYSMTVGAGGTAASTSRGQAMAGSPSALSYPSDNITSVGGGRGGCYYSTLSSEQDGGSGGGAGASSGPNVPGAGYFYPGPTQQGYPGGQKAPGQNSSGGGGGGAGGAGQDSPPRAGGAGKSSSITGASLSYAGGGGGGTWSGAGGSAGPGGGGVGGGPSGPGGSAGQINTGGGGGGGGPATYYGNDGGPGVVIFAYPNQYNQLSYIESGTQYELLPASSRPGYHVYKFKEGFDKTIRW